jgi:hypothetical protein
MESPRTLRFVGATAATALLGLTLGAAPASAGVSGDEDVELARAYNNEHYALLTGPPFEQGCAGEFPLVPGRVVNAPGGVRTFTVSGTSDAWLFDLDALGFDTVVDVIIASCTALATGGELPEPLATGTTYDVFQGHETADGGQYRDSSRGTLYGEDGTRYEVKAGSLNRGDDDQDNIIEQHLVVKIR